MGRIYFTKKQIVESHLFYTWYITAFIVAIIFGAALTLTSIPIWAYIVFLIVLLISLWIYSMNYWEKELGDKE